MLFCSDLILPQHKGRKRHDQYVPKLSSFLHGPLVVNATFFLVVTILGQYLKGPEPWPQILVRSQGETNLISYDMT